jgi:hypothetical protein
VLWRPGVIRKYSALCGLGWVVGSLALTVSDGSFEESAARAGLTVAISTRSVLIVFA